MISPVINYTIKGMIWYQGESNRGQEELYGRLMPVFVKDLRQKWGLETSVLLCTNSPVPI
ncbi:MAG: sialate O-acetylesterase [Coprobacter sp.]